MVQQVGSGGLQKLDNVSGTMVLKGDFKLQDVARLRLLCCRAYRTRTQWGYAAEIGPYTRSRKYRP